MRTTGPLIVGIIAGWIGFGDLYIPNEGYRWLYDLFRDFAQILTAVAFILGGLNLIQVNYPKIRRRELDWQYKILMLVSAVVVGLTGIEWHTFGGERSSGSAELVASADVPPGTLRVNIVAANKEALVTIAGKPRRAWHGGDPADVWTSPGDQPLSFELTKSVDAVKVVMPTAGYREFSASFGNARPIQENLAGGVLQVTQSSVGKALKGLGTGKQSADAQRAAAILSSVAASLATPAGLEKRSDNVGAYFLASEGWTAESGMLLTIETDLVMRWGAGSPEGRVFTWFYDYVFVPCNATMFALLAFFIASAAFRAFRARNVESALLLGAAILVMIGIVPFGRLISPFFPELADWILDYPNNAGRRAIMMGAALGAIVTGLRVILGLERSHLGSDN